MPKGDRPAEVLTPGEIRAILSACNNDTRSGVRDHALLAVMWRTGLRISEALQLTESDVDFPNGSIRVRFGKGRKARTVGCDDAALAVLAAWVSVRDAAGIGDGPLFCRLHGQPGAPLSDRYVRYQMVRLAKRAGVRRRAHPHGLRHALAVESVREGVPVTKISRQLGHNSISTTQTYCDHLWPQEVVETYRAREWAS